MASTDYKTLQLAPKYTPKKSEPYMCPSHLAYFYQILMAQREELLSDGATMNDGRISEKTENVGDEADNAAREQELNMSERLSQRDNNLLRKINGALERMENGTYGYSVVSGEAIGLSRMMARPLATMTVDEQEEYENRR